MSDWEGCGLPLILIGLFIGLFAMVAPIVVILIFAGNDYIGSAHLDYVASIAFVVGKSLIVAMLGTISFGCYIAVRYG